MLGHGKLMGQSAASRYGADPFPALRPSDPLTAGLVEDALV
jgi:hypothetical protein